jgi:cytidylate kinase
MDLEGIDQATAERRLRNNDAARASYRHKFYGIDPTDDDLYHLVIDSTAFDVATCVDPIVAASDARTTAAAAASRG